MRNTEFPKIVELMQQNGEALQDLVNLLGYTQKSQVSRRLSGKVEWTIGDVEILCRHYNVDFYELFRRKEDI